MRFIIMYIVIGLQYRFKLKNREEHFYYIPRPYFTTSLILFKLLKSCLRCDFIFKNHVIARHDYTPH